MKLNNKKSGFKIVKCSDCGNEVLYRTVQKEYVCYDCISKRNIKARDREYLIEIGKINNNTTNNNKNENNR